MWKLPIISIVLASLVVAVLWTAGAQEASAGVRCTYEYNDETGFEERVCRYYPDPTATPAPPNPTAKPTAVPTRVKPTPVPTRVRPTAVPTRARPTATPKPTRPARRTGCTWVYDGMDWECVPTSRRATATPAPPNPTAKPTAVPTRVRPTATPTPTRIRPTPRPTCNGRWTFDGVEWECVKISKRRQPTPTPTAVPTRVRPTETPETRRITIIPEPTLAPQAPPTATPEGSCGSSHSAARSRPVIPHEPECPPTPTPTPTPNALEVIATGVARIETAIAGRTKIPTPTARERAVVATVFAALTKHQIEVQLPAVATLIAELSTGTDKAATAEAAGTAIAEIKATFFANETATAVAIKTRVAEGLEKGWKCPDLDFDCICNVEPNRPPWQGHCFCENNPLRCFEDDPSPFRNNPNSEPTPKSTPAPIVSRLPGNSPNSTPTPIATATPAPAPTPTPIPTNTPIPTPTPIPPTPVPPSPTPTPQSDLATNYDADGDGDVTRQEFGQVLKDYTDGKIDYARMLELLRACKCLGAPRR